MRTSYQSLLFWIPALVGGACLPSPTDNALGWNGRGMLLPVEAGALDADRAAGGTGTAGSGTGTGGATQRPSSGGTHAGVGGSTASGGSGGAPGSGGGGAAGSGGGGSPPIDAGLPPPPGTPLGPTCHLDVSVTTHSGGGSHSPKNVDAIWIEDASGKFVKTLYVMARDQIQHLDTWNAVTTTAGLSRNRVDAVTGATLPSYGTRTASWNCFDVTEKVVKAGGYQVCFDLNDGNGTDKHTCDSITLGTAAAMLMPPDALPCFTARALKYTP